MTDIASLSFGIDTSDVRRGSTDLDGLSQSSDRLARSQDGATAAHARFLAETANLIQRTSQMRAQFEQTTASLDGLLQKLDSARQSMNQGADSFASFASARAQVEALGAAYGQTSTQLELYNQRAVQIGLSSQQTVMSLQRITDAMTAQTAAGQAIKQTMLDYGVSLEALTGGNAAAALQSFVEKIKTVSDSATKFRQVQAVLGPLDTGTYAGLSDPDYIPLQTQRQRAISRQINQQVADTTRDVAIRGRQSTQNDSAYDDLSQQFSVRRVSQADRDRIARELGPVSNFSIYGTSNEAGRLSLLQYLGAHPNDRAAAGAMSPAAIAAQVSQPTREYFNQFSNGIFSANQEDIAQRKTEEQQSSGFLSPLPFLRATGRTFQNLFGSYQPPSAGQTTRPLSFEEEQARDNNFATGIGRFGYGDGGYSDMVAANGLQHDLNTPGVSQQFITALGSQEGNRLYGNIRNQIQRRQDTARVPGQDALDQNATQGWLLSIPREQRAQAQALIPWLRQNAPDVNPAEFGGRDLGFVLNPTAEGPSTLGLANVGSFNKFFSGQVANAGTSADQDHAQQMQRQSDLNDAIFKGSSAVEDLTTHWQAYDAVVGKVGDAEAKRQAGLKDTELAARRTGDAVQTLVDINQKNAQQSRVFSGLSAAGSDPADRESARVQADLQNQREQDIRANREFGRGPDVYTPARARGIGQAAVGSAQDMTASSQRELDNQRSLLSVATQRADVQAKMARDQAINDQYAKALGDARASDTITGAHAADQIQAQIDKAKELKDALSQVNAEAALFKMGNEFGQSNENEAAILALPRSLQGAARARLPVLAPFQGGGLSGGAYSPGNDAGLSGSPGVIPSSDRLSMAQSAVSGTPIPPELLVALVSQESSWNPSAANGGLGQILPSTATSPGFQMTGVSPTSLQAPGANLAFTAQYLAARGAALGMSASDWHDPTKVANVLQAYNGGGDPNYVQHVERYLPGGYFSSASPGSVPDSAQLPGAVVPYGTALNSAVADPAGRNALNAADRGYQLGIAGQVQVIQAGASQQQAASAAALPLLSAGQTGLAQYARAGAIGNNPDTLDPLRAGLAQQSVVRSQQEDFAGQIGSLNQNSANNEGLAQAYSQSQQAVDAYNEAIKANAIVMRDGAAAAQDNTLKNQALAAVQKDAASQQDLLASQRSATDQDAIDRNIYQSGLGIGNPQQLAQQMNSYDTEAYINKNLSQASPEAQQGYRNNQSALVLSQQQVQDQQKMQGALDQAGNAVASSFASAIVSGKNLHSVFASLLDDLAQIAIKAVITKPITNAIDGLGSSLFGGSTGLGSGAFNGASGFFGGLFGSSSISPLLGDSGDIGAGVAPALSPGAAFSAISGSAFGNVFSRGMIQPFASGGVINSPTTWMMANGDVALAGEAGSEAIMPLKRLPNGNLGVQTGGGGSGSVTVNTPITIQQGGGAGQQMDAKTLMAIQSQIERSARTAVKGVIADERRPGGDLYS